MARKKKRSERNLIVALSIAGVMIMAALVFVS